MRLLDFFGRLKRDAHDSPKTPIPSEEDRVRSIVETAWANGDYCRIYHHHIRKTGGTTINFAFLSNSGREVGKFYIELANAPERRLVANNRVFVGWNGALIKKGFYFYAFSHAPMHRVRAPEGTFTITCLRDPVRRVISHYHMLRFYQLNGIQHKCMEKEGPWLGSGFNDFLENIPKENLLNHLYMFSKEMNVEEAIEKISTISCVLTIKNLKQGLSGLAQQLNITLPVGNEKKYNYKEELDEALIGRLREKLQPEYDFLKLLGKEGSV